MGPAAERGSRPCSVPILLSRPLSPWRCAGCLCSQTHSWALLRCFLIDLAVCLNSFLFLITLPKLACVFLVGFSRPVGGVAHSSVLGTLRAGGDWNAGRAHVPEHSLLSADGGCRGKGQRFPYEQEIKFFAKVQYIVRLGFASVCLLAEDTVSFSPLFRTHLPFSVTASQGRRSRHPQLHAPCGRWAPAAHSASLP